MNSYEKLLQSDIFIDKSEDDKIRYIRRFCLYLTYNSLAIEGNSLTFDETKLILNGNGRAVPGVQISDQYEAVGHEMAVKYLLGDLHEQVSEDTFFKLHRMIDTQINSGIYAIKGGWKVQENGTFYMDEKGKRKYIQYAKREHVRKLMGELIFFLNMYNVDSISYENAHKVYARAHIDFMQTHPFHDANGKVARLISNVPLLRAGFSPIVIPFSRKDEYIKILSEYSICNGIPTAQTGLWQNEELLEDFNNFCLECSIETEEMLNG